MKLLTGHPSSTHGTQRSLMCCWRATMSNRLFGLLPHSLVFGLLAWGLYSSLCTRRAPLWRGFTKLHYAERHENPVGYWFSVAMNVVVLILVTGFIIFDVLPDRLVAVLPIQ